MWKCSPFGWQCQACWEHAVLTAFVDGMQKDIMIKWAQYIENDNCLQQEFHFAVPKTLWKLNMIWNKTRDLFKVKLYTIRSETKKKRTAGRKKVASTHVRWLDWILGSPKHTLDWLQRLSKKGSMVTMQHQQQRSNWYQIVSIHLGFERQQYPIYNQMEHIGKSKHF